MNRQIVSSSNLRSVGYDPDSMVLEIEFRSNDIYQYFDVPESVYAALMNASSKGKYHHKYIKNHYRYKQVK